MTIRIEDVEQVLQKLTRPLTLWELHALSPAREPYRVLLLQPEGTIEGSEVRVGHADRARGHAICSGFIAAAVQTNADLAVTPEYCLPWSVLEEIVQGAFRPPKGALWVLGCESIAPGDLLQLIERHNRGGECVFHIESIEQRQVEQKRYVDPLVYVFWARDSGGEAQLVFLIQLKTVACRDYRDIEQTSLCVGKTIYAFNRGLGKIGLMSIICSDAFDFVGHIDQAHLNCLLIHIQLNPRPAHTDYAAYRSRLCAVGTNSHVELLCLNWAKNVKEAKADGSITEWKNVAGSAWYAPPLKFGTDDESIDELHRRGLYYSVLSERWHALFLNYEGHILQLQKQKLMFLGEQAIAPRSFVAVEERWTWESAKNAWAPGALASDGLASVLASYHAIATPLLRESKISPVAVERAVEILVGPRGSPTNWHSVGEIDSFRLDKDEESIRRVTVHQESETSRPGVAYRRQRLQRAHDAIGLAQSDVPWPAPVKDLSNGFLLVWSRDTPNHNIKPVSGDRGAASLAYLGDQADDSEASGVYQKLSQAILGHAAKAASRTAKSGEEITDMLVRALDRLCVVYRRDNKYGVYRPPRTNEIDTPAGASPVDYSEDRS